ncbi:MAG: phage baseplate assembly protein [Desulfobacterales bacterium]|nr:phage baseplate assembly protein [Desulfobacterales bacterium]
MMQMIRGKLQAVTEGVIKRFSALGRVAERFVNREYFQHYGFTSRPLAGAEMIVLKQGNVVIAIASDDRRYRLAIVDGEAALHDDQGQAVHLKRDKKVHVYGTDEAIVDAAVSATVTAPQVTVVASTQVTMTTPLVAISGNLTVGGTAVVTGALSSVTSVADPTGTMNAMRQVYNPHAHPGDSGGTTGTPNNQM